MCEECIGLFRVCIASPHPCLMSEWIRGYACDACIFEGVGKVFGLEEASVAGLFLKIWLQSMKCLNAGTIVK